MPKSVIKTYKEFAEWCSKLRPIFSLDTETSSLKWLELEIIGLSICDGKQACYVSIDINNRKEILNILQYTINEAKLIIFANAAFDLMVLRKYGIKI